MTESLADVEFIVRSDCRVQMLELLSEHGRLSARELRENLDVVRTTVQRNLEALEERDLVRAGDDGYEITPTGELVATDLRTLLDTVEFAAEAGPILSELAAAVPEFDVDPRAFTDATVVEATPGNPYAPVEKHRETMAEADHVRLALPVTGADALETARERIEEGAVHEMVVTDDVAEALLEEPGVSEPFGAMVEAGSVAVYRYDGDLPCYLGVLDDAVQFGVLDEVWIPRALLETTHPDVRAWALERYESYRADAERLV